MSIFGDEKMKKLYYQGFWCEIALSALALVCLVVSAICGKTGLIWGSAIVMLALLFMAAWCYIGYLIRGLKFDSAYEKKIFVEKKKKEIIDKITTVIFIILLSSPFIILLYIFLWFVNVS